MGLNFLGGPVNSWRCIVAQPVCALLDATARVCRAKPRAHSPVSPGSVTRCGVATLATRG